MLVPSPSHPVLDIFAHIAPTLSALISTARPVFSFCDSTIPKSSQCWSRLLWSHVCCWYRRENWLLSNDPATTGLWTRSAWIARVNYGAVPGVLASEISTRWHRQQVSFVQAVLRPRWYFEKTTKMKIFLLNSTVYSPYTAEPLLNGHSRIRLCGRLIEVHANSFFDWNNWLSPIIYFISIPNFCQNYSSHNQT